MKKQLVVLLCLAVFTAVNAQRGKKIKGNGNVVTIERQTGDYDGIAIGGFYEVELVDGAEGKITMTGEDNILEYIETEINGGTLTIKSRNNTQLRPSLGKKVFISVPVEEIDAVRLSGSGTLRSSAALKSDDFKVHTSGSRNAELSVEANAVTVISSGSSNIALTGTAESLDITASGSSNLNAFELIADRVDIRSSGSSNMRITANKSMESRSSGSSNIMYRGNPNKIHNKSSGSSKITKE